MLNMDDYDFIILKNLMENSRITYRELAEVVDISVSAVHKRINKLIDDEIINGFTARPSVIALKCLWIMIFGTSKAKILDLLSDELGQHENIDFVGITGGRYMYVAGYLRNISKLQDFSTYVSKTAQISEPTIGIINIPYITAPEPLSKIDFKILKSLNKDSRKPITDVADDIGISTKTVKKRLDRMIKENLATLTIQWTPKAENNFSTAFHIYLKEGTDIASTIQYLNNKFAKNNGYCFNFSNIPNFITMHTWTRTAHDSQQIQEELQTEGFQEIIPHIFISAKYYDCWIDELLRTK